MTRLALRLAILSAFAAGAFSAIFFGFVSRPRSAVPCHGCGLRPTPVLVAKVSIRKGTSATAIGSSVRYKTAQWADGSLMTPSQVRGEVTSRTIPAGARLTAADFALRGPVYYPRGFPKRVPASQVPAKMSRYLPRQSFPSDLEVAPGVWVDGSYSEAAIDEHVANGTLVGYCRSIRAFRVHNPEIPFATKCWRS